MAFVWTDARIERAKQLYIVQGFSAAQTAAALGGDCTRNSVVSKAHRMGWMKDHRQKPTRTSRPVKAPVVRVAPVARPPKPAPHLKPADVFGAGYVPSITPEEAQKRSEASAEAGRKVVETFAAPANDDAVLLINRRFGQYSWPVGEPERPADQLCCGAPVPEGANKAVPTYCAEHAARAVNRSMLKGKPDPKAYERSLRRFANA